MLRIATKLVPFVACVLFSTAAAIPDEISFQGRQTDATGAPVPDGLYGVKFTLYDQPSGGNILWSTGGYVSIQFRDGLFSHSLGSTSPLPDSLSKCDSLWLGISIGADPEITPRSPLTSVPFAFRTVRAQLAARSDSSRFADTAQVALNVQSAGVPVGTVLAWLKSFTGTPALPDGFVECNGQTLSDPGSPFNGATLPNLNGENRYLRGNSTSGGLGGSATHAHQSGGDRALVTSLYGAGGFQNNTGNTSLGVVSVNNEPPFLNVVWIVKVK